MSERWFLADDGRRLRVVPGFRAEVLGAVSQYTPRADWTRLQYRAAARKRVGRGEHVVRCLEAAGASLRGARVLEVGTGSGLDTVRLALEGVESAVGIDREPGLMAGGERARLTRRLARSTLAELGLGRDIDAALARLPVKLMAMRAQRLEFPDDSFDIVWSRTALEHLQPLAPALEEMARVLRPGGIAYHGIDPYNWVRGCHRRGLVDIPWAHARLTPAEIERFHAEDESRGRAQRLRRYLEELNHLGCADWKDALGRGGPEVVDWRVRRFPWVRDLLRRHPEVMRSLRPGVSVADLTACHIEVVLRT